MANTKTDIIELLNQYHKNDVTQRLREKFLTPSLFDIIQKDRSETVHSNFLKWLFDLQAVNGIEGFNIISSLLRVAYTRAKEQGKQFPFDLAKAAYGSPTSLQLSNEVVREYPCPGVYYKNAKKSNTGIVDIVISATISIGNQTTPLKIIIENKVDSKEHDLQTWKYYTYFEGKVDNTPDKIDIQEKNYKGSVGELRIYLFLTPESNPSVAQCNCEYFIKINYQDIMDHCIDPLLHSSQLDSRSKLFLEEYSRALSLPYINNKGKTNIMCLNPTDAALLKEFWDANQELISLSLVALKQSLPEDNEEKNAIDNTLEAINALQGKRTKYTITHNGTGDTVQTNQTNLMYELVNMYIKYNVVKTWQEFEKKYSTIPSIFCKNETTTGYKWNDKLNIGITTQKQRYAEQVKKIKAIAAKDGFTIQ